jgi:dihydrofolate reductase
MGKLKFDISVSLDGFVAGPNPRLDEPLGEGGEQLHEWIFGLKEWREPHGLEGGETVSPDSEVIAEGLANIGAYVMGRNMFGGGEGPWDTDEPWQGWWGDDPPFHLPVFVLTHHPREPLELKGGTTFTFITDGPEEALEQARKAAGDHDVKIAGGAEVARRYLRAGLLDEFELHVVPVFLGGGTRLFEGVDAGIELENTRGVRSPTGVVHLRYRTVK